MPLTPINTPALAPNKVSGTRLAYSSASQQTSSKTR